MPRHRSTEFRLSRLARLDLIEISDYTQDTWGDVQAERYLDGLEACFWRLVQNPELGRPCASLPEGYRRLEHGRHVIFYRLDRQGVFIARILHQRMLPDERVMDQS